MLNDQKKIVNAAPQGGIAQIANVAQCYQAITRTEKRHALAAGIAAFYGPSGLGKSIAALYVANKTGAYYVQAKSVYTRKAFLQAILREMAIVAAPTLSEMLDQVAGELAKSGKPLIIDEFDFLVTYGKLGDGFIECHHNKPVSKMKLGEKTNIVDLALLCSNCHRMIHRRKPWLSVPQLKDLLSK